MNVTYSANESQHLSYTVWFNYTAQTFTYHNNVTNDCATFPMQNGTAFPHFCTDAYGTPPTRSRRA